MLYLILTQFTNSAPDTKTLPFNNQASLFTVKGKPCILHEKA